MHVSCEKHPFETAEAMCQQCGHDFCEECLVFVKGPKKPPTCIACSLAMAGIRSSSAITPKYVKSDMKRIRREQKRVFRTRTEPAPDLEGISMDTPLPSFDTVIEATDPAWAAAPAWGNLSPGN